MANDVIEAVPLRPTPPGTGARRLGRNRRDRPAGGTMGSLFAGLQAEAQEPLGELPREDNTPASLRALLQANRLLRTRPWLPPFDHTTHRLRLGDARDLSWIPDASVHLVVTSPPYWTLKQYRRDCLG